MKRFRVRFINEVAITQPATKPADVSFDETQEQIENTEEQKQENALIANGGLQPQDVDNMTDGAVLGTMLSPNQDIQDDTLQALGKRATDFVNKVSTNTITPQEKKDIGNEVVANFKTAQKTGFAESLLWNDLETKILKSLNKNDDFEPMYTEAYSSGRVDGGDEYDFSGAISGHYDDRKTFEEFCLELAWELEADLENQFALSGKEVYQTIEKWIEQNKEWVRERFGLHDDVTESDVIRARKMMLPILNKKFGK